MSPDEMARLMLRTHGDHAALMAAMRADFWLDRGNAERNIWWGKVADQIRMIFSTTPSKLH